MKELPYTIRIPSWKVLFVHAGLLPDRPVETQLLSDMTMMRNVMETEGVNKWIGSSRDKEGEPWVNQWNGGSDGYHVYFGHDAKRGLQLTDFATGLDTGCAYGRKLSAVILPSKALVQVTALRAYEPIKGGSD